MLLGVLVTLALPPVTLLPLAVVGFTGLIWLLDGAPRRLTAIGIGWWFGVGHSASAYYWIANSLLVDAAQHVAPQRDHVVALICHCVGDAR